MTWIRILSLIALAVASALDHSVASAASSGKVIIAQGVDPSTLDPMNHQESPAANVCRNIFDTLLERDQDLKIQPMLARELPRLKMKATDQQQHDWGSCDPGIPGEAVPATQGNL